MASFYIIDGHSYIYRAYHAIRGLSTSAGFPTNAIYGFTNMLMKIIRENKPDYLAVALDSGRATKRQEIYEDYKSHRPPMPEDLAAQIPHIRRVLEAFRVESVAVEGEEADDIIATLTTAARAQGIDVFLVTSDKDLYQLVGPGVRVYDTMKNKVTDESGVVERFGVEPARISDLLALMGDTSDNIPGAPGVGEKTARALIAQFGGVEQLLAGSARIERAKLRAAIDENADLIRLSYRLATLNHALPIPFERENLRIAEPDWQTLLSIFHEFEFTALAKTMPSAPLSVDHCVAATPLDASEYLAKAGGDIVIQTESAGRRPLDSDLAGIAISAPGLACLYVPNRPGMIEAIRPALENPGVRKTGHNLKKDIHALRRAGIALRGVYFDTMIASYLLNPNRAGHSLEEAAFSFLNIKKRSYEEAVGGGSLFDESGGIAEFLCENTAVIRRLAGDLAARVEGAGLSPLMYGTEMPLIPVLAEMEAAGISVDMDLLGLYSGELASEMEKVERRIYFYAGERFNINSPKQLSEILFQKLRLPPVKKTKTGYSTDVDVLEELAAEHELPREIIEYRTLSKLKGTYVDALPVLRNPKTGRVHTTLNQTVAATGRLSSSDPNLQNIPVRGAWGKKIRAAFVAADGMRLLSADYSQIELRVLAHLSRDPVLSAAFQEGVDVHAVTASRLFGLPPESVTAEMRRRAKTVNFGVVYGMSPFGLAQQLGISAGEAKRYIDRYFETHHGVAAFIEQVIEKARKDGFVTTMFGRRRDIPELKGAGNDKQLGRRLAVNSPIQGAAADIIKSAMLLATRMIAEKNLSARMLLQVHDELLFEAPDGEMDALREIVKTAMESAAELTVPLKVEIGVGRSWAEAH